MLRLLALLLCATLVAGSELVCYDQLGCFDRYEYPYYQEEDRPVDHLPESRAELGTTFMLRTRDLNGGYQELRTDDDDTISSSAFKPWLPTKVIIHGFVKGSDVDWMNDMATEFLDYDNYNVFMIDWRPGLLEDRGVTYDQAVGNVRVVGAEVALFLERVMFVQAVGPSTFHIIAHSLGAHVAGIAGAIVPNIGRITGLDPAGPYFDNSDIRVRLDASDATFVDVIHTDTDPLYKLGLGMYSEAGHVDFFPNSGREQPGCDVLLIWQIFASGRIWGGTIDYIACNHIRAVYLFMESINSWKSAGCPFTAFTCTREWEDFNTGQCWNPSESSTSGPIQMGWLADQYELEEGATEVVYQLNTLGESPYCGFQHRFNVQIDESDDRRPETYKGKMMITLFGEIGQSEQIALSPDYRFYDQLTQYIHVGVSSIDVGTPLYLLFEWEYDAAFYAPWDWEFIERPELFIHRIEVESESGGSPIIMCGSRDPIEPDLARAFYPVNECN